MTFQSSSEGPSLHGMTSRKEEPIQEACLRLRKRDRFRNGIHRISSLPHLSRLKGMTPTSSRAASRLNVNECEIETAKIAREKAASSRVSLELEHSSISLSLVHSRPIALAGTKSAFNGNKSHLSSLEFQDQANVRTFPTCLSPIGNEYRDVPVASKQHFTQIIGAEEDEKHAFKQDPYSTTALDTASIIADDFNGEAADPGRRPLPFQFWQGMPPELRIQILKHLTARELISLTQVCRLWQSMCLDGALWQNFDASAYYRSIPASMLLRLLAKNVRFIHRLNLRGCVQFPRCWGPEGAAFSKQCQQLRHLNIQDCSMEQDIINRSLRSASRLLSVNLACLNQIGNSTLAIIATYCPLLEELNVSWCSRVNQRGLCHVVKSCSRLRTLECRGVTGLNRDQIMHEMFLKNALETFIASECGDLDDEALRTLCQGTSPTMDVLTDEPHVPTRNLQHLNLRNCTALSARGIEHLAHLLPHLQTLILSRCPGVTDEALKAIIPHLPALKRIEFEELGQLTNDSMRFIALAPCHVHLEILNISFCEAISDDGMIPIIRACSQLREIIMDNTSITDSVPIELAIVTRRRSELLFARAHKNKDSICSRPQNFKITQECDAHARYLPRSIAVVLYDCQHITHRGILEMLKCNTLLKQEHVSYMEQDYQVGSRISPSSNNTQAKDFVICCQKDLQDDPPSISIKCYYEYQSNVDKHARLLSSGTIDEAIALQQEWSNLEAQNIAAVEGIHRLNFRRLQWGRIQRRRWREAIVFAATTSSVAANLTAPTGSPVQDDTRARHDHGQHDEQSGRPDDQITIRSRTDDTSAIGCLVM